MFLLTRLNWFTEDDEIAGMLFLCLINDLPNAGSWDGLFSFDSLGWSFQGSSVLFSICSGLWPNEFYCAYGLLCSLRACTADLVLCYFEVSRYLPWVISLMTSAYFLSFCILSSFFLASLLKVSSSLKTSRIYVWLSLAAWITLICSPF